MKKIATLCLLIFAFFSESKAQELGFGFGWVNLGEPQKEIAEGEEKPKEIGPGFGFRGYYTRPITDFLSFRPEFAYNFQDNILVDYEVLTLSSNFLFTYGSFDFKVYAGGGIGYDWVREKQVFERKKTDGHYNWDIVAGFQFPFLPQLQFFLEPRYTQVLGKVKIDEEFIPGMNKVEIYGGFMIGL